MKLKTKLIMGAAGSVALYTVFTSLNHTDTKPPVVPEQTQKNDQPATTTPPVIMGTPAFVTVRNGGEMIVDEDTGFAHPIVIAKQNSCLVVKSDALNDKFYSVVVITDTNERISGAVKKAQVDNAPVGTSQYTCKATITKMPDLHKVAPQPGALSSNFLIVNGATPLTNTQGDQIALMEDGSCVSSFDRFDPATYKDERIKVLMADKTSNLSGFVAVKSIKQAPATQTDATCFARFTR